jgi:4-amino-4-deoxy-L-arabinose transferase-like glycosyltransferase
VPLDRLYKSLTDEAWKKDWWLLLFIKVIIGLALPLFADEAYYWVWAKNLKLSYFDHPPMISWLFAIGQLFDVFFSASRLPTLILGHLTCWVWCEFLASDLNSTQKRRLLWILALHFLTGLGVFVANPDVPFLFFWSLSLFFFKKSVGQRDRLLWPALLGLCLGLGFASKYLMALFVPCAMLYLCLEGRWRQIKPYQILIPIVVGALFSAPVWLWNFQNDWVSFSFQFKHGLGRSWQPRWTLDFLAGTLFLLYPPFLFIFFKKSLWKSFSDLHFVFFSSLFFFFTWTTLKGDTELNWPLALYPSFFFLVVKAGDLRKSFFSFVFFFGFLGSFLLAVPLLNWSVRIHPRLSESRDYHQLFVQTQSFRPLYVSTYQVASSFWFLSKLPVYKLRGASRIDEFDFMENSNPQEDVFYFLKEREQSIPPEPLLEFNFTIESSVGDSYEVYKAVRKK